MQNPAFTPYPLPPPRTPRQLRRGIALLPSLFTVANLGMGWFAIQQTVLALQSSNPQYMLDAAAKAIGWAIVLDGFDGRIARMANATSAFGHEFDSLADVISFGVAPALLAYVWGVRFLSVTPAFAGRLNGAAQIAAFLFVVAGAARLARFNISTADSSPSNPGKPGKRYFVGMPIPAAAGTLACVVHFCASPNWVIGVVNSSPTFAVCWLVFIIFIAYMMVSTWRFYSFKEIDLGRRRSFVTTVLIAAIFVGIWFFSEAVLSLVVLVYLGSALVWRAKYYWRRKHARAHS